MFTRSRLAAEIISRAVSASSVSVKFRGDRVGIKLIFGDNVDEISYIVADDLYSKFLKPYLNIENGKS